MCRAKSVSQSSETSRKTSGICNRGFCPCSQRVEELSVLQKVTAESEPLALLASLIIGDSARCLFAVVLALSLLLVQERCTETAKRNQRVSSEKELKELETFRVSTLERNVPHSV